MKLYTHMNNFNYQVSPIPSNAAMANIAKMNNSKFSNRITARRALGNNNASMLGSKTKEILSEDQRVKANETAAPNVVIYNISENVRFKFHIFLF